MTQTRFENKKRTIKAACLCSESCVLWHYSSSTLCAVTSVPRGWDSGSPLLCPTGPLAPVPQGTPWESTTVQLPSPQARGWFCSRVPGTMAQAVSSALLLQEPELLHTNQPFPMGSLPWSLHCQGAAQPPNSDPSGRDIHNFHLNPGVSLCFFPVVHSSVANGSTPPVRIAAEASLDHLHTHLPEKHWKNLNIQLGFVLKKRSACLKKYKKVN